MHFEMISTVIDLSEEKETRFITSLKEGKDIDFRVIDGASPLRLIDLRSAHEGQLKVFLEQADKLMSATSDIEVICQVVFDHDYITTITQVMALRLIWANLCEAYDKSHLTQSLVIEGFVSDTIRTSEIHQDLISITQIMAAMFSADVDVIFPFHHSDQEEDRRYIRQAYHVLTMEGHLGKVKAPYSGSYALEKIAVNMAQKAWSDYSNSI